jgi:hypothetical protein
MILMTRSVPSEVLSVTACHLSYLVAVIEYFSILNEIHATELSSQQRARYMGVAGCSDLQCAG